MFWLIVQICLLILLFVFNSAGFAQVKNDTLVYVVKPGDYLIKISKKLGDRNFQKALFDANKDKIDDPNLIYPGQKLFIPVSVRSSEKFVSMIDSSLEITAQDSLKILERLRKAFRKVVEAKKKQKAENSNPDYGLGLGGLVIDETRSKMGNDFYNIFYKYWQAPENAGNFILTISEQPSPSIGTVIFVKINHEEVFRAKLQPRYAVIEKLAHRAALISYQNLQQQNLTSTQLNGY
ncbi:MAG TPA: CsgE family curli-type amyloid fiber assembly protein [Balneolaceae bacterium]